MPHPLPSRALRALALAYVCLGAVPAGAKTCRASFYDHGSRTANGEHFRPMGLTAAHKTLPFGALLHVGYGIRNATVRINDRGPFIAGRCLDLSRGAARAIGLESAGVGLVHYERVGR